MGVTPLMLQTISHGNNKYYFYLDLNTGAAEMLIGLGPYVLGLHVKRYITVKLLIYY